MIDPTNANLSVRRQCELLQLSRSGVYRPKSAVAANDLAVMRRIDELHLDLPFYGSRRMTFELNGEGHAINRKHVQRLMRVMGIAALVPRPGTSKPIGSTSVLPLSHRVRLLSAFLDDHRLPHGFLLALQAGNLGRDVVAGHRRDRQANQNDAYHVVRPGLILLLRGVGVSGREPILFLAKLRTAPAMVTDLADIRCRNAFRRLCAAGDRQREHCQNGTIFHDCSPKRPATTICGRRRQSTASVTKSGEARSDERVSAGPTMH
jgi:hypothetical protein